MNRPELLNDPSNANLTLYKIEFYPDATTDDTLVFECWAEDEDHAIEQLDNAYGEVELLQIEWDGE